MKRKRLLARGDGPGAVLLALALAGAGSCTAPPAPPSRLPDAYIPPPDRDGDGIPDSEDGCADVKGLKTDEPKTNGCPSPPPDRDGDGIPDGEDACPDEKGLRDPDPHKSGCPKSVRVTETEVLLLNQIQFDTAKAALKKVSEPLLDEVADVLKSHPEIVRVEVQGHTDNRESESKKLAEARAAVVKKALVERGVNEDRLTTTGHGPNSPIADNLTDEGRQKNRRVQFIVLEKRPKGSH